MKRRAARGNRSKKSEKENNFVRDAKTPAKDRRGKSSQQKRAAAAAYIGGKSSALAIAALEFFRFHEGFRFRVYLSIFCACSLLFFAIHCQCSTSTNTNMANCATSLEYCIGMCELFAGPLGKIQEKLLARLTNYSLSLNENLMAAVYVYI